MAYTPLDDLTFYSLLSVLQGGMWLLNDLESFLLKYHMSYGRFSILLTLLDEKNNPLIPVELSRKLGKSKPTISRMIAKLEADGYIEETADSRDRRAKRLILTSQALDFLDAAIPEYNTRIRAMSSQLSEEEKRQLMNLIGKINFLDPAKEIVIKT